MKIWRIVFKVLLCISQLILVFLDVKALPSEYFDKMEHISLKSLFPIKWKFGNIDYQKKKKMEIFLVKFGYILEIGAIIDVLWAHNYTKDKQLKLRIEISINC